MTIAFLPQSKVLGSKEVYLEGQDGYSSWEVGSSSTFIGILGDKGFSFLTFKGIDCASFLIFTNATASSHSSTTGYHCIGSPLSSKLSLCTWCNLLFSNLCNFAIFSALFLISLCFLFFAFSLTSLHLLTIAGPAYLS